MQMVLTTRRNLLQYWRRWKVAYHVKEEGTMKLLLRILRKAISISRPPTRRSELSVLFTLDLGNFAVRM